MSTDRWESPVDRAIREAQERGEFDNLPGHGKPLPDRGELSDENWWLKRYLADQKINYPMPPAIALAREVEYLPDRLAKVGSQRRVREIVEDLNRRILAARRGPTDGPPVTVRPVDVDATIEAWRAARS